MNQPPPATTDADQGVTTDEHTRLCQLKALVRQFVEERHWQRYHAPKNISMALAVEAAELMEHFQWLETEASRQLLHNADSCEAVAEELADVICYALALANELNIDVASAMRRKMVKNREKYPPPQPLGGGDD